MDSLFFLTVSAVSGLSFTVCNITKLFQDFPSGLFFFFYKKPRTVSESSGTWHHVVAAVSVAVSVTVCERCLLCCVRTKSHTQVYSPDKLCLSRALEGSEAYLWLYSVEMVIISAIYHRINNHYFCFIVVVEIPQTWEHPPPSCLGS